MKTQQDKKDFASSFLCRDDFFSFVHTTDKLYHLTSWNCPQIETRVVFQAVASTLVSSL